MQKKYLQLVVVGKINAPNVKRNARNVNNIGNSLPSFPVQKVGDYLGKEAPCVHGHKYSTSSSLIGMFTIMFFEVCDAGRLCYQECQVDNMVMHTNLETL
jgi:hypothetical protein